MAASIKEKITESDILYFLIDSERCSEYLSGSAGQLNMWIELSIDSNF